MNIELKNIIAENCRRKKALAALSKAYNPLSGEGCAGERIPFLTEGGKSLFLLKSQVYAPDFNPLRPNDNRFYHDFEFWAASVFRINGQPLKFSLAYQSVIRLIVENGNNGRFLIMHASNLGITALCEAYILWRELFLFPGSDAVFCFSNARHRKSFRRFCHLNLTSRYDKFNIAPRSTRYISSNILSANNRMTYNCFTTSRNMMTVNGLNIDNLLIADANASVIADPRNFYALQNSDPVLRKFLAYNSAGLIIIESSPDSPHLGGFFNNCYREAIGIKPFVASVRYHRPSWLKNGEIDNITPLRHSYIPPVISGFIPVFIPWYADEFNARPLNCSVRNFWNSLSPHEYYLWEFYMCSLEQINWYRHAIHYLYNNVPQRKFPASQFEAIYHRPDLPKYYVKGKLCREQNFHPVPCAVIYRKMRNVPAKRMSPLNKIKLALHDADILTDCMKRTLKFVSFADILKNTECSVPIPLVPN